MAIWDYRPQSGLWIGVAIGVGVLVAPVVFPMVAGAAKPVAKGLMKTGLMLYEKGTEMVAEFVEAIEDLAVEAKSEVRAELTAPKKRKT